MATQIPVSFPPPSSSIPLPERLPQSRGSDNILENYDTSSGGFYGGTPSSTSTSISERRSVRLMCVASKRTCSAPSQISPYLPLPDYAESIEVAAEVLASATLKKRKRKLLDLYDSSSATESLLSPPTPTSSQPLLLPLNSSSPLLIPSPLLQSPISRHPCSSFDSFSSIPSNSSTVVPLSPHASAPLNTTSSSPSARDSAVDSSIDQNSDQCPVIFPESDAQSTDLRSLCCPVTSVCEYVKAVCRVVFPIEAVWGTRHNLSAFLSAIDR